MKTIKKNSNKYSFLTTKRNISSGARSPSNLLELQDSTRLLSDNQNHSTLGSRNAIDDSMGEMGRAVNNLTANTNSNANTGSSGKSIVVSVKSKKRSLSYDSDQEHLNKKILTSQDNANIKDNKQYQDNPEAQDNQQSQGNDQSQDNDQLQNNDQSQDNQQSQGNDPSQGNDQNTMD